MTNDGFEPQLTWLHVSDIHAGSGGHRDAAELEAVFTNVLRDVDTLVADGHVAEPTLLIFTGDVSQRGGGDKGIEFKLVDNFISDLKSRLTADLTVLAVPGNHDCVRVQKADGNDVNRFFTTLRQGGGKIDDAFADTQDAERLRSRFEGFMKWQRKHCPRETASNTLTWTHSVPLDATKVELIGINTAWLAQDPDKEVLQFPRRHLTARSGAEAIRVLVMHHPFDWLRDGDHLGSTVQANYDIVLSGHMHNARHRTNREPGQTPTTWVQAGATHTESKGKWTPDGGHAYSIGSVGVAPGNRLVFRVYPRVAKRGQLFVTDSTLTEENALFSEDQMPEPNRPPRLTGRRASARAGTPAGAELPKYSGDLLRQYGRRRTAFPTDLSLDELADKKLTIRCRVTRAGTPGTSFGSDEIVETLTRGDNVLLLGTPGSGKSVAIHEIANAAVNAGLHPLIYRFSDVRRLFGSGAELQALKKLVSDHAHGGTHMVIVDGLDEASGTETGDGQTVSRWLRELASLGPMLISCRAADYRQHLAAYVEPIGFDALLTLEPWRVEIEFRTFVRKLADQNLIPNDHLVEVVKQTPSLGRLVTSPLFARMLTLIGPTGANDVKSEDDLYTAFFAGLGNRTAHDFEVADVPDPQLLWREAARAVFSLNLVQDETINLKALIAVLTQTVAASEPSVRRALSMVIDRGGGDPMTEKAAFLHYSFYEFLLAAAIAERLSGEESASPETLQTLAIDIPRRIRHFLVGRLRSDAPDHVRAVLQHTYLQMKSDYPLAASRPGCNLIAYLLSRGFDSQEELLGLYTTEDDPFLQNSLRWALTHSGNMEVAGEFIDALDRSAHYAAMCRGYLLYYHGDLPRETQPPFFDLDPAVSWTRTRAAVLQLMSDPSYDTTVAEPRRVIDLYTFLSFALLRNQMASAEEGETVYEVLEELWAGANAPGRVLQRLQAMAAVVCPQSA